jgi:hypothetical protein
MDAWVSVALTTRTLAVSPEPPPPPPHAVSVTATHEAKAASHLRISSTFVSPSSVNRAADLALFESSD